MGRSRWCADLTPVNGQSEDGKRTEGLRATGTRSSGKGAKNEGQVVVARWPVYRLRPERGIAEVPGSAGREDVVGRAWEKGYCESFNGNMENGARSPHTPHPGDDYEQIFKALD
jgi:hypothetical protein